MHDLLSAPFFADLSDYFQALSKRLQSASILHLHAPASLEGLLAIGQLEAACLDSGIKYTRRFFPAKSHRPRDETVAFSLPTKGLAVYFLPEEETWALSDLDQEEIIKLVPLSTRVQMGSKNRQHLGAVDCVLQATALASSMAPNGRRVRSLRPFASLGLWLRGALDTSFDPIHTSLRVHLRDEGTIRVVPLTEVPLTATGMIPGLSERQCGKLRKAWPKMDLEQRTTALSELILPCLTHASLSTPRL